MYVFIGDRGALLDFAMLLHERGLTPDEEYVVVAADVDVDEGGGGDCQKYIVPVWNEQWSKGPGHLQRVHEAFRSVLMVLPAHRDARTDQTYWDMAKKIQDRSLEEPFCEPHHPLMDPAGLPPLDAAFMYDAVKVYALAAHEVLETRGDLRNGTDVVRRIVGREGGFVYRSDIMGLDVRIDERGDSEGNYIVLAMVDSDQLCNMTNTSFLRVGDFNYSYSNGNMPVFY